MRRFEKSWISAASQSVSASKKKFGYQSQAVPELLTEIFFPAGWRTWTWVVNTWDQSLNRKSPLHFTTLHTYHLLGIKRLGHWNWNSVVLWTVEKTTFRDQKCHFWYPRNRKYCANYAILGVPKVALPVPETKIQDHFYRPNTPPKPRKNHIGNTFSQLESGFLAILFILHILVPFLECKKAIN